MAGTVLFAAAPARATPGDLSAYMRARAADADGAVVAAASDYARALTAAPDEPVVAVRALREAVRAGDMTLADRAIAVLSKDGVAPPDTVLLTLAGAARAKDFAGVASSIAQLQTGPLKLLSAPLRAWALIDAGGDPLGPLAERPTDPVARRFVEETRALVLIATGHADDGIAALRVVLGNDQASQDNRIAAARLLIGQGRGDQAKALLVGDSPAIVALRARTGDKAAGAQPSLAFGAAQLFIRVASDLAAGKPTPVSYTLAQSALRADPGADRARVLLAATLAQDGATDRALQVLDQVAPGGIYASAAAIGRVQILSGAGRDEAALAAARALADDDVEATQLLADLYLRLNRPADAAPLYRRLIDRAGKAADWADWLQYGGALDRAGRWAEARPALERAVKLAPDEPVALNYLGYSLIEHRERMDAAQAMLEKAVRLKPDDAAITDSLGWSLYRRGETARAVPLIERAAAAEPDNAEIAEHLGDAYWSVGRRYEARYAWTAARQVAEPADVARLMGKIADGL
jgi:tetratricopeptide (TPR) repeat protein